MLDGAVDALEAAALEAHMAQCPDCAAYCDNARALDDRLREELTGPCDFDRLWGSVQERIVAEDDVMPQSDAVSVQGDADSGQGGALITGVRRWAGMAIAAMILLGAFAGGTAVLRMNAGELPIVTETVRDFETFRIRGGLLDVAANEPGLVREWVATRVDFHLPGDVDPPAGFEIAGGRLCSFLNRRLAFLHYKKGPGSLSLYVMKATGLKIPEHGQFKSVNSANGLTTVTWRQSDLAFVVVSNLPSQEVTDFAASFKGRALAPAWSNS